MPGVAGIRLPNGQTVGGVAGYNSQNYSQLENQINDILADRLGTTQTPVTQMAARMPLPGLDASMYAPTNPFSFAPMSPEYYNPNVMAGLLAGNQSVQANDYFANMPVNDRYQQWRMLT